MFVFVIFVIYSITLLFKVIEGKLLETIESNLIHLKLTEFLREAFKRKKRKYIGLLPIGGTPPPNSEDW